MSQCGSEMEFVGNWNKLKQRRYIKLQPILVLFGHKIRGRLWLHGSQKWNWLQSFRGNSWPCKIKTPTFRVRHFNALPQNELQREGRQGYERVQAKTKKNQFTIFMLYVKLVGMR